LLANQEKKDVRKKKKSVIDKEQKKKGLTEKGNAPVQLESVGIKKTKNTGF